MGHTRLGAIPKTRKWNELFEQVSGFGLTGDVAAAATSIDAIAAQTLDAAQKAWTERPRTRAYATRFT